MWPFDDYYDNTSLLIGKTVVITGSNAGIGKEMAKNFYQRGGRIVMACRNMEKAEEAAKEIKQQSEPNENNGSLVIYKLDLNGLAQVRICAREILDNESRIDILINNAGVFTAPDRNTQDGFESHFGVNHLGPFLFTVLLLPRITETERARIINISSVGHKWCSGIDFADLNFERRRGPYWIFRAYGQSKLANILFTKELAKRLKEINSTVTTYSLHPGVIETKAWNNVVTTAFPNCMSPFIYPIRFVINKFLKTPFQGIQTTIYCALDEQAGKESGLYYRGCKATQPSHHGKDEEMAKKLWEVSLALTGLGQDFDPFQIATQM